MAGQHHKLDQFFFFISSNKMTVGFSIEQRDRSGFNGYATSPMISDLKRLTLPDKQGCGL